MDTSNQNPASPALAVTPRSGFEDCARIHAQVERMSDYDRKRLLFHLLCKRENDGLNGRGWDGGAHLYHETVVNRFMLLFPNTKVTHVRAQP